MKQFNYEGKVWGITPVRVSPVYIQALKLKYVLEDLRSVQGKVADVGCGAGNMAKAIKYYRPDLEVYGVDFSAKALLEAKKSNNGVIFKRSRAESLPFAENSLDAVVMFDVLEHIADPTIVLSEIYRVLKEDGMFHIFSPLDNQFLTPHWLCYRLGWKSKDKYTGHVQWFSDESLRALLRRSEFSYVQRRFSYHWFLSWVDVLYYTVQDVFGMKASSTVEGRLAKRNNAFGFIFGFFYKIVVVVGYFESCLLKRFSWATGGHYLLKKVD